MPHQNTAPCSIACGDVNLARYDWCTFHFRAIPATQGLELFIIWSHLFNKLHVSTNLCKQCPRKKCLQMMGIMRFLTATSAKCLDLQMPEKFDPSFEYPRMQFSPCPQSNSWEWLLPLCLCSPIHQLPWLALEMLNKFKPHRQESTSLNMHQGMNSLRQLYPPFVIFTMKKVGL